MIKGISGDFLCISLIAFRCAKGIITKLFNKDGIDCTDKDTSIRESWGNRFVVSSAMFHVDFFSLSRFWICWINSLMQDCVWGKSQGGNSISFPGLGMVTVFLHFGTSIPTAFMRNTLLECNSKGHYQFSHCLFNLLGVSHKHHRIQTV